MEIWPLIKQRLTLGFKQHAGKHLSPTQCVCKADPTRKPTRASMQQLQNQRTCQCARLLLGLLLDLSHRPIRLMSVWHQYLIPVHHFLLPSRGTTSRVSIPRSNTPRHCALAQADRPTKHRLRETQPNQRQHARPHAHVAQQHAFNSWLVR